MNGWTNGGGQPAAGAWNALSPWGDRRGTGRHRQQVQFGETSLQAIGSELRPTAEQLWQLYQHDLSEFRGSMPDDRGLYRSGRLTAYFEEPGHRPYLILSGSTVAGFALVRGLIQEPRMIGEFFVVRAARRRRIGHEAALRLLHDHPGRWEIAFQEANPGAARFWRAVATEAVGDAWMEEPRPVPGRPDLPPDMWLMLTT